MNEKINIELELNSGSFIDTISAMREEVSSFYGVIEDAPNATAAFNQSAIRMATTLDSQKDKTEAYGSANTTSKQRIVDLVGAGVDDLDASLKLYGHDKSFSAKLARQWFAGLPAEIRKELDALTPEINRAIRNAIKPGEDVWDAHEITRKVMGNSDFARVVSRKASLSTRTGSEQLSTYMDHLVRHIQPAHSFDTYRDMRYGFSPVAKASSDPRMVDILPKLFQDAYLNRGFQKKTLSASDAALVLDSARLGQMRQLIASNDAAFRAAQAGGQLRRSRDGSYRLSNNISQGQFEDFKGYLWGDYVNRASGRQSSRMDFYDQNLSSDDMRKLVSRASGGSAGNVLNALNAVNAIDTLASWSDQRRQKVDTRLKFIPRRELEQYEVSKFRFGDLVAGNNATPSTITISESMNTRALGLSGKHNQHTDKVVVVGLSDYDRADAKQVAYIERLLSGEEIEQPGTGKKYVAQNIHGTGRDTVLRMVEASAYREVEDAHKNWAAATGFTGANYWKNFISAEELAKGDLKGLRKHYDATGKGWSPGHDIGGNLADKQFAIVDLSKVSDGERTRFADGLSWFGAGILPEGSIQARIGVGGKGTAHDLGYQVIDGKKVAFNTLGEWAVASGFIKQGERFMLPGLRGMVDVTDMHGMQDVSQIKNLEAYNQFQTSEEVNAAHTNMLRRFGISSMTTYDDSETKSRGIGSQMMLFLRLSPKMRNLQTKAYQDRLAALDTDVGIREFILGNPNDYLAREQQAGNITVNDARITRRVNAEKESLRNRALAGEWIDFGGMFSGYNQKANKTSVTSVVQSLHGSREEQIAKLREMMRSKGLTRDYTDDEIAGIWGLGGVEGGAIVDFTRSGPEDEIIGVGRSPNGYGQFVYGKNYAPLAKDVFKAFGIAQQGIYLSDEDMFTLGGADFDGDGVKSVYDDIALAFKETSDMQKNATERIKAMRKVKVEQNELPEGVTLADNKTHRRLAVEAFLDSGLAMGLASTTGDKASMVDLYDPRNQDYLIAALQANAAYVEATAQAKKNTHFTATPEMMKAQQQGKSWHKLPKAFSSLFNVTGQDDAEIPAEQDIFVASNGVKVNLAELRDVGVDRINLPSVFQESILSNLLDVNAFAEGSMMSPRAIALMEALDKAIGYGDAGETGRQFMKNMRTLKVQELMGMRGTMSQEEESAMRTMKADAEAEIDRQIAAMYVGAEDLGGGIFRLADGTEVKRAEHSGKYRAAQRKALGLDILDNHFEFGITARNLTARYGTDADEMVTSLTPDTAVVLPDLRVASAADVLAAANTKPAPLQQPAPPIAEPQSVSAPEAKPTATPATVRDDTNTEADLRLQEYFEAVAAHKIADVLIQSVSVSDAKVVDPMRVSEYAETWFAQKYPGQAIPEGIAAKWRAYESTPASSDFWNDKYEDDFNKNQTEAPSQPSVPPVNPFSENVYQQSGSLSEQDVKSWLDHLHTLTGSTTEYQSLIEDINSVSNKWYKTHARAEDPEASYYSFAQNQLQRIKRRAESDRMHGAHEVFGDTTADNTISEAIARAENNYILATRAHLQTSGSSLFESLQKSVNGTGDAFDKQLKQLEQWSEAVNRLEKDLQAFQDSRQKYSSQSQDEIDADRKAIEDQQQRIDDAKVLAKQGKDNLLKTNNEAFISQYDSLYEAMTGKLVSPEKKIKRTVAGYKDKISLGLLDIEEAHAKGLLSDNDYASRIANFKSLETYADSTLEAELLERYHIAERRRMAASTKRVENLRTQGRRLDRNAWGRRGNDALSRSLYEWESGKDQYDNRITALKTEIDRENDIQKQHSANPDSEAYKTAEKNLASLKSQLSDTEASAKRFSSSMGAVAVTMNNVGESVGRLITQFGRQMFNKALQEAKRFVQDYDTAMTEIQMVTMKTDAEISQLGADLIQTAIDMKVSVSDVTSAATNLYRQGISDEEVDVRMEDVLKFSKVAGIKSAEASKIITTALSNDLVESSGEAMDALVAQGDAAATSAEEIAKGMQKSAASAKQAGVSYEQLVTMLTIITSKTQLGGNQAGTALQTLMYRLYRVREGDDFYDENGRRIAANAATKALSEIGVSIYDDQGNTRNAFDILLDVSQRWDDASNISQERILNELGAGRQRTNIATLIQGLAEDDGALMQKYMSLATNSEGITDRKNEAYLNSLNGAINELQSSFDQLIATFDLDGITTSVQSDISEIIQGLTALEESTGAVSAAFTGIGVALMAAFVYAHPILTALAGAIALITTSLAAFGNDMNARSPEFKLAGIKENLDSDMQDYEDLNALIKRTEQQNAVQGRTAAEQNELTSSQQQLSNALGISTEAVGGAAAGFEDYTQNINDAKDALEKFKKAEMDEAMQETVRVAGDGLGQKLVNKNNVLSSLEYFAQEDYTQGKGSSASTPHDLIDYIWNNRLHIGNAQLNEISSYEEFVRRVEDEMDTVRFIAERAENDPQYQAAIDKHRDSLKYNAFMGSQFAAFDSLAIAYYDSLMNPSVGASQEPLQILPAMAEVAKSIDSEVFAASFDGQQRAALEQEFVDNFSTYAGYWFTKEQQAGITKTFVDKLINQGILSQYHINPEKTFSDQYSKFVTDLSNNVLDEESAAAWYDAYVPKEDPTRYVITDISGISRNDLTKAEVDDFVLSEVKRANPDLFNKKLTAEEKPIWIYTDSAGTVHTGKTYAELSAQREADVQAGTIVEYSYNGQLMTLEEATAAQQEDQYKLSMWNKADAEMQALMMPLKQYIIDNYAPDLAIDDLYGLTELDAAGFDISQVADIDKKTGAYLGLKEGASYLDQLLAVDPAYFDSESQIADIQSQWDTLSSLLALTEQPVVHDVKQRSIEPDIQPVAQLDENELIQGKINAYWDTNGIYSLSIMDALDGVAEKPVPYLSDPIVEGYNTYMTDEVKLKEETDKLLQMMALNSVDSMGDFNRLMESSKYGNLTWLFQSIGKGRLAEIVRSAAETFDGELLVDDEGRYVFDDNKASTQAAWEEAYRLITAESASYQHYNDSITSNRFAQNKYAKLLKQKYDEGMRLSESEWETMTSIYGSAMSGKMQNNALSWWDTSYVAGDLDETGAFAKSDDGKYKTESSSVLKWLESIEGTETQATWENYQAAAVAANRKTSGNLFSADEQAYFDTLTSNLLYGISGLTSDQAVSRAQSAIAKASEGSITEYLRNSPDLINALTSQFSSFGTYSSIAQMLEASGTGYTIEDLRWLEEGSAGYSAIDAALQNMGSSAKSAKNAVVALHQEIDDANSKYGKLTSEVFNLQSGITGTTRQNTQVIKDLSSAVTTAQNESWLYDMYINNSRDAQIISNLASMYGLTEEQVRSESDLVAQAHQREVSGHNESLRAYAGAYSEAYLSPALLQTLAQQNPQIAKAMSESGSGAYSMQAVLNAAKSTDGYDPTYLAALQALSNVPGLTMEVGADGKFAFGFDEDKAGTYDRWMASAMLGNINNNTSGLTPYQQAQAMQIMMNQAAAGSFKNFFDGNSDYTNNMFLGISDSAAQYARMAYKLEGSQKQDGTSFKVSDVKNWSDLSQADQTKLAGYLGQIGQTTESASDLAEDFEAEVVSSLNAVSQVWGDMTSEVIEGSKAWTGSAQEIAEAWTQVGSAISNMRNNQYYRDLYMSGDRSEDVVQAISAQLSLDADIVRKAVSGGFIDKLLNSSKASDQYDVDAQLAEASQFLADTAVMSAQDLTNMADTPLSITSDHIALQQQLTGSASGANNQAAASLQTLLEQVTAAGGTPIISKRTVTDADVDGQTSSRTVYVLSGEGITRTDSEADILYQNITRDKYGTGISSPTMLERLSMVQQAIGVTYGGSGSLQAWMSSMNTENLKGFLSIYENLPLVMDMARAVEEATGGKYSLFDLPNVKKGSVAYQEIEAALNGAQYTAQEATQALDDLNTEMQHDSMAASGAFVDNLTDVESILQQLSGTAQETANAFKSMATTMSDVKSIELLQQLYNAGSRDNSLVSAIEQATGLTASQIYEDPSLVAKMLNAQSASSQAEQKNYTDAISMMDLNDALVALGASTTGSTVSIADQLNIGPGYLSDENRETLAIFNALATSAGWTPQYTVTDSMMPLVKAGPQALAASPVTAGRVDLIPITAASGLHAADLWYAQATSDSILGGSGSGLTDVDRFSGASQIMAQAQNGTLGAWWNSIQNESTRAALLGSLPAGSMESYISTASALESQGLSMSGLSVADDYIEALGSKEAVEAAIENVEEIEEAYGDMYDEVKKTYGKLTSEITQNSKAWKGNAREISNARKQINSTMETVTSNQWARSEFAKGSADSKVVEQIASMVGLSTEAVKEHREEILKQLTQFEAADLEEMQVQASGLNEAFTESLNKHIQASGDIEVDLPGITGNAEGTVDFSDAAATLSGLVDAQLLDIANMQSGAGIQGYIDINEGENGFTAQLIVTSLGQGRKSGGGGGGGGGKSAIEKLLEEQEREVKMREHKIKMIQYEETRYANANELTNQAIMIQHEIDEERRLVELRSQQIEKLKQQMATVKKYSDDWYELRDAIMSAEEAVSELNNTIDENEKKIKELEQQVLKLHTDLESAVKDEIETRIQAERNMLDGTVSMQDIILEAIRERYRKEWELMQEDLNKKREALEEEMSLIDERLQRRKDAEDEAAKYEELAELQRQLAMISLDSTRTKDQAELREQITELEKELAWDAAEDEAESQKDSLQQQIDAYDDYEEEYQKYLDELLEDANNFSDEVNTVLSMNQEDLLQWLSENVEEFRLSLKESQESLVQNWTDTFKQMKGIVDTFWEEIAATLSSQETFLEYMKQSQTYQNASDDEKAQMEYTWSNMYEDWFSAQKESEEAKNYDHVDDGAESTTAKPSNPNAPTYKMYYGGWQKQSNGLYAWITGYGQGATQSIAETSANDQIASKGLINVSTNLGSAAPKTAMPKSTSNDQKFTPLIPYAEGGYVDYTGLALVHGSTSRPEAFLSADDTALMRAMLDSWQLVLKRPTINNVDAALGRGSSGATFGDLSITITEASFADDADIEEVARRVGDAFTKELSKQGFRTATFNF